MKKIVTSKDIVISLEHLGIKKGDKVMVHCALSSFGKVQKGADTIIDSLLNLVSPAGTIIMPTFGSSDPIFDPAKSKTSLGVVAQNFWQRKNAVRSRHPVASIAAIGADAEYFIEDHENSSTAHGNGTPYMKLAEKDAKILLLGVDLDRMTFLHSIETVAQLPYLRPITRSYIDAKGKTQTKTWQYFPGPHRDFIGLQSWLKSKGLVKETLIGSCCAKLYEARPLLMEVQERLNNEPDLFISDNPNLPAGIWQKADILKARWTKQPFTIAADSQFAGKYIEEIIENCKFFRIENIILSFINNVPWTAIDESTRKWYLQGLKQAKIKVKALRLPFIGSDDLTKFTSEAGCNAIIIPSTINVDEIMKYKNRITVLLENSKIGSHEFVKLLSKTIKAAFNPLAFVESGENPFLKSYYKTSLKSQIGALYINDGFASGERTKPEEGLAEIKELISILLCRSFDGIFIVQAQQSSTFRDDVRKFIQILEEVQ